MNSLDNILGGGEAAPEGKTETEQNVAQAATEGASQTEQTTEGQTTDGEGEGTRVPVAALQAERQKVKRYTEEVADFRKSNEALQRQVAELMQRIPPPQQQQPKPPTDFFDNPDQAFQDRLQASLGQVLGPIEQQMQFNARLVATSMHGKDKTEAALAAFDKAAAEGQMDEATFHRVRRSPNPFHEAVQWHQSQLARQEIGDDPAAFRAKVEAEIREKVLAELQQQGNGGQAQALTPPVTPSNLAAARNVGSRSGPAWAGPASLQDIFDRRPGTG